MEEMHTSDLLVVKVDVEEFLVVVDGYYEGVTLDISDCQPLLIFIGSYAGYLVIVILEEGLVVEVSTHYTPELD